MGQVVPFIARVRESGDWTAAERARLQDLADRLAAGGVDVEVIFGATDEGDPWCVVTDGGGDVLIHVARIDGKFVVHSAVDDAVNENVDLHAALRDRLAATDEATEPQSATILPFGLTARQGQTFLALVVAAAFFYETAGVADTAEAAEPPEPLFAPEEPMPPAADAEQPTQERELAVQGATLAPSASGSAPALIAAAAAPPTPNAPAEDAAPSPPSSAAPLETTARSEAVAHAPTESEGRATIQGGDGDDLLVGSAADEHIIGGSGNDTLRGGGGDDLLEGGAGDDRIELAAGVTAIGGEGADTFVIQAPAQLGQADTLLGVILDFAGFEGDRLVNEQGEMVRLVPRPATDEKTTPPGDGDNTFGPTTVPGGGDFGPTIAPGGGNGFGPTTLQPPPLTRVEVDLDGDGVIDGYILVGTRGQGVGGEDNPIVVTGRGLTDGDPIGG